MPTRWAAAMRPMPRRPTSAAHEPQPGAMGSRHEAQELAPSATHGPNANAMAAAEEPRAPAQPYEPQPERDSRHEANAPAPNAAAHELNPNAVGSRYETQQPRAQRKEPMAGQHRQHGPSVSGQLSSVALVGTREASHHSMSPRPTVPVGLHSRFPPRRFNS